MKVSKSSGGGAWIDKKSLRNGDKIKIVSEAIEMDNQQGGTQLVAKVRVKGSPEAAVNLSINSATKNALIEAFGDDTASWVDQILTAHLEKTMIAGKRGIALYLVPDNFEVTEDAAGYVVVLPIGASKETPASQVPKGEDGPDYSAGEVGPDEDPNF